MNWQPPTPEQREEEIKLAMQLTQDAVDRLWSNLDWLYVPSFWDEDEENDEPAP